jgi:hypothetical protein
MPRREQQPPEDGGEVKTIGVSMIPLPGASFVYSLLKDIWSWGLSRFRGRRFQLWARGWTVDDWYDPYDAAEKFGNQGLLRARQKSAQQRDKVAAEWGKVLEAMPQTPKELEAREQFDQQHEVESRRIAACDRLINEGLNGRLATGELIARGFREPFSHGAPYLTISRHEWKIIKLEPPDRAQGGGVSYVGLTIGKVGTKSFFRPRRRQ